MCIVCSAVPLSLKASKRHDTGGGVYNLQKVSKISQWVFVVEGISAANCLQDQTLHVTVVCELLL